MSPMTNSSARKRHENTTPKETPMDSDNYENADAILDWLATSPRAKDLSEGKAGVIAETAAVHTLLAIHDLLDERLPKPTTEWLEDIALELHAITGLLNERLARPTEDSCGHPNHGSDGHCCAPFVADDDPDEALARALECAAHAWDYRDCDDYFVHLARAAREHIADWRADEVERLLAVNRDLATRVREAGGEWKDMRKNAAAHQAARWAAEAERDELRDACNSWQSAAQEAEYLSEKFRAERDEWKAKAERVDDSARRWKQDFDAAANRAERAEAELETVKTTLLNGDFQTKRADDLEGLLQAARSDRDTWEAAYKRADDAYSRARDERDEYADKAEWWEARHAALRADVEGGHEEAVSHHAFAVGHDPSPLAHEHCAEQARDRLSFILARDDERGGEQS